MQWKGQLLRTWELEENLSPDIVAEFKSSRNAGQSTSTTTSNDSVLGFQRGLEAERIVGRQNCTFSALSVITTIFLGMYEVNGELMFKMKWKGCSTNDFVPVDEAKLKCPQVVIAYYEKRIVWLEA